MPGIFSSLFRRSSSQTARSQVALVTNFSACPLGLELLHRLAESNSRVVAVAHDASRFESKVDLERVSLLDGFPNEPDDRVRVVSFLISNQMQVGTLVQNQPFMLKPTVDQPKDGGDE